MTQMANHYRNGQLKIIAKFRSVFFKIQEKAFENLRCKLMLFFKSKDILVNYFLHRLFLMDF